MRILVIDQENLGLDFVLRCADFGHEVRWDRYADPKHAPLRDGEGFKGFRMIDDWDDSMSWAKDGLIITTGNFKFMPELDRYRDHGFKIFSPTAKSAALEIDRAKGMAAMGKAGIQVPHFEVFDGLEAALKFAWRADKPYVFKPMGDEEDKSLTFVAHDPAELVGWLQRQMKRGKKLKGKCMLQEKIDMLAELGVSGWFGPEGFLPDKWQICFEHKKLMNGDIGPSTGEQGTVCQYVKADKLAHEMLVPMTDTLLKAGHRGDFAINAGIDKQGKAWAFEFTARAGWPAFWIQTASHRGDPAQWMRDLLDGKDTLKVREEVAIGVVMAQPRYPYNESPPELVEGNPINGLDEVWDDAHPASVMIGKGPLMDGDKIAEGPVYETAGEYVLCMTGLGDTVKAARKAVYRSVEKVSFPDVMYRTDIGEKLEPCLPELHAFGYADQMRFE